MLIGNFFISIFTSSNFFTVVYPHVNERYFIDKEHILLFKKIQQYNTKYNKQPSITDIKLMIETDPDISEIDTERLNGYIKSLKDVQRVKDEKLLIKEIESFFQNRALELAIMDSFEILQNKQESRGKIEENIKKALSVEFDVRIGQDFFKDAPERYKKYIEKDEYFPCDVEAINIGLNGGFRKKSLSVFIGRTNIGKTIWLCHLAASFLKSGKNVVYISAEMSEDMISKRIDANLLDISMSNLNENLEESFYLNKVETLFKKTQGKLIVKEYATGTASALHVRNLLNEIHMKRNFKADVLIVDYLNIFASSRLSSAAALQSYLYVKAVTEEFRGIGTDHDLAVISATQTNRSGAKETTEIDMGATADSYGLPMSVDWLGAILQSPELFEQNKYLLKVLKSRFGDNINSIYTLGVDRPKMRLLNLSEAEQEIPQHIKDKLKVEQDQKDEESAFDGFDFN